MKPEHLNPQARRILDALETANAPVDMPTLTRIGSGKPTGFCGSFSRRISDIREAIENQGQTVTKTEQTVDGQRQTFYALAKLAEPVLA